MDVSTRLLKICVWELRTVVKAICRHRLGIHIELSQVTHLDVSVKESLPEGTETESG